MSTAIVAWVQRSATRDPTLLNNSDPGLPPAALGSIQATIKFFLNVVPLIFLLGFTSAHAIISTQPSLAQEPPALGNFALSTSQQPGPFFSFGQNIVDQHQFIVSLNPNYSYSKTQQVGELIPSFLYGLTDNASLLVSTPMILHYKNGDQHLSGIADVGIDLEYAFYSYTNARYSEQATLILAPTLPTGSSEKTIRINDAGNLITPGRISGFSRKNAPAGYGTPTYFFGGTYSRSTVDWYGFAAPGLLMPTSRDFICQGKQYMYNLGLGRSLKSIKDQYIVFGLLELNGQYSGKTLFRNDPLPNTGGSIIYATPSVWLSTPRLIIQLGLSLPVFQHWYGNQSNIGYYASSSITWTLN